MNQRIAAINDKIDSILAALHWDRQDLKNWYIQEQRECVSCPFDRRHLVPRDGQESHLRKCMEKHQKDGGARRKLPSSARYFYAHAPAVVSFQTDATVEDQQKRNAQGVLVYPLSDDSSVRFARELRIKYNRPDPGPGNIHDMTQEEGDKADTMTDEQSSSGPRAIKRRPKTYRVKVTKQRTAIEVQRQLVQAYMQELK
ncbi:hypothetical protein O0I10_003959 [Lichtheimia ornata]|uniref:CHHC U11-48K-type domain-containing protein n=1 Tax=Lichtheimia ornata TaxID=688661 RepID=A0AAD7Y0V2_9FUNG|nr:uncharacterized protein O0I10_003959 [Lichtheimia ornata]KAJ8660501.1 hypothetical protein O0I10_003959 [Lichtheimia ornata]